MTKINKLLSLLISIFIIVILINLCTSAQPKSDYRLSWTSKFNSTYDSLFILETVKQFVAIIRQEGAKGFNPNLINGGFWSGVGGLTTSFCKVFRFEIQGKSRTYFLAFHGTLVVDFAYYYYSIVQQWETGIKPYWVSLNYYPYSTWTLYIPPDPGYGLIVLNKINVTDIIYTY